MKALRFAPLAVLGLLIVTAITLAIAHGNKPWPVPEAAKKRPNPVKVSPEVLKAARANYVDRCERCHGETGKGDGYEAMMYEPKPIDLTDAHMMSEMTDGEIFYKITEGRKPMPSFKKLLSDEERWQLVHLLRSFVSKSEHHHEEKPAAKKPAKKQ